MRQLQCVAIAIALASANLLASAQTARFQTHRAIEFRLAENEAAPGLIAVHIAGTAEIIYVHPEVQLDDRDVKSAAVVKDEAGQLAVQVRLRASGIKKFHVLAQAHRNKRLAIAANDKVISAPVIVGDDLVDDLLDITGALTAAEAAALAKALRK